MRGAWAMRAKIGAALMLLSRLAVAEAADATARVYVANISSNDVSVIDTATNTVIATVPVGGTPDGIAASPDGAIVYVANAGGNSVSIIDTTTNAVIGTVSVGQNPIGIAFTPDGTRAYVCNFATPGSVSVHAAGR